jgi:hypothetical protein
VAENEEAAEPTTTIRVAISVSNELTAISKVRKAPKQWLTEMLLQFAMPRVELAIDEWKNKGTERAWQQRSHEEPKG